jgi:hypothetical protein
MTSQKTGPCFAWIVRISFIFLLTRNVDAYTGPNLQAKKANALKTQEDAGVVHEERQASRLNLGLDTAEASRRTFLTSLAVTSLAIFALPEEAEAREVLQRNGNSDAPKNSGVEFSSEAISAAEASAIDWKGVFEKASKKALGGGKAGASAAVVQVFSLMWLRTSMNYQYRYGGNLVTSLQTLWKEGGISRLYQGLPFALVQGPLTRFGDTAANVGILVLLETLPETQSLPLPVKTAAGSFAAGLWRIVLMPIDSSKTAMQVEGAEGLQDLWGLVGKDGPSVLYQGAVASAAATAAGHFPWFLTYNWLNDVLPQVTASEDLLMSLVRSAAMGFGASCVSDVCSNSLRVIKTTKQTARLSRKGAPEGTESKEMSYPEVVKLILEEDGVVGLFGRGLQTRLLTNSIQGAAFSVLWRFFQQTGGVQ